MGFTCNSFNFPNLFLAPWPSAAWDLLAIHSIFQICFWRFGQVLHGIYLQFIQFSKSVFGQVLHGIYLQFIQFSKSFFWLFGQVLNGIYLQFIQFSKSVFGALAKCCMGFTCSILQFIQLSKSVSGALAKCCTGFTCNLCNFPNLFRALWPSAAWDLLAVYSIFQICFGRFGQVLHGIYLQFMQFSKSVSGALAKCCMGFTCSLFNFPNLFRALWPSAAWDLLAIYSMFQICFGRFGQVVNGLYLQLVQFS